MSAYGTNSEVLLKQIHERLKELNASSTILDDAIYTDGTGTPSKAIGVAGTDGTNPQIIKTDSNGELQVDILSVAAGANIIGKVGIDQTTPGTTNAVVVNSGNVGGFTASVATTPTLSVGGAAATGDYVGTSTMPQSFANAVRTSGGTGIIKSISIVDKLTTTAVALELWVFSATFTAPTDNAAWSITDADALNLLGVIPIETTKWYASALNKAYSDDTLGLVIKPAATSLFYALVARGTTPAWATGDLQITLGILQD